VPLAQAYHDGRNPTECYELNPELLDFVIAMLQKDPARRPRASQLLTHGFTRKGLAEMISHKRSQFARLQRSVHEHIDDNVLRHHDLAVQVQ
jgi:serine/threonine protein kinase